MIIPGGKVKNIGDHLMDAHDKIVIFRRIIEQLPSAANT